MKGFKQYGSLVGVHYKEPEKVDNPKNDVPSPADKVLDLIFAKDVNGWPNSSVEVMLSSKTSDEVRRFITDNLMVARDAAHLVNDPSVINEFQKLESSFIAQCSRNRFESIEDYEQRLNQIIQDDDLKATLKKFSDSLKQK